MAYATAYSTGILTCDLVGYEGMRGHNDKLYIDVKNVEE